MVGRIAVALSDATLSVGYARKVLVLRGDAIVAVANGGRRFARTSALTSGAPPGGGGRWK